MFNWHNATLSAGYWEHYKSHTAWLCQRVKAPEAGPGVHYRWRCVYPFLPLETLPNSFTWKQLLLVFLCFVLFCWKKIKDDEERPDHFCVTSHLLPGNYFQNVSTAKNLVFVVLLLTKMEHQHKNLKEGKSYHRFLGFLEKKHFYLYSNITVHTLFNLPTGRLSCYSEATNGKKATWKLKGLVERLINSYVFNEAAVCAPRLSHSVCSCTSQTKSAVQQSWLILD